MWYAFSSNRRAGLLPKIWDLLKASLPEFKLPDPPADPSAEGEKKIDDGQVGPSPTFPILSAALQSINF